MFVLFKLFFLLWIYESANSEHLLITYNYVKEGGVTIFELNIGKNLDLGWSENLKTFANLFSNSNRYWTSNFEKRNIDSKSSISFSSGNIEVVENVPSLESKDSSEFLLKLAAKFAAEFYKSNILKRPQKYGEDSFKDVDYSKFEINNSEEFRKFLAKHSRYAYILFFRKNGFENNAALLKFINAIRDTSLNGGLIDCEINAELCEEYLIDSNPRMVAFENEEIYKTYDFGYNSMEEWMLTLEQPFLKKLEEADVPNYRSGIVPGFLEPRDTVTMMFVDTKKSAVYRDFVRFARENHGKYHLLVLVSKEIAKWSHYPAFVTMKPYDPFVKAYTLYKDMSYQRIAKYIEESVRPNVQHLKFARDFFYFASTDVPLIIMFDPLKSKDSEDFQKIASNHQLGSPRSAFFGVIDSLDIFSLYLTNMFKIHESSYIVIKRNNSNLLFSIAKYQPVDETQLLNIARNVEFEELNEIELRLIEKMEKVNEVEQLRYNIKKIHDEL